MHLKYYVPLSFATDDDHGNEVLMFLPPERQHEGMPGGVCPTCGRALAEHLEHLGHGAYIASGEIVMFNIKRCQDCAQMFYSPVSKAPTHDTDKSFAVRILDIRFGDKRSY